LEAVAGQDSSSGMTKGEIWGVAILIGFLAGVIIFYVVNRIRRQKGEEDVHLILPSQ